MNTYSKQLLLNPLKDEDVTKLSGCSKTPLVVRSHCGRLDYLSPLGVLMAILPYMPCPKSIPSTATQKPKRKPETAYKQRGLTPVRLSKTPTPEDALDVHTKEKYPTRPILESGYDSRSRGLTMHSYPTQEPPKQGILAIQKVKKTGLYRINSRKNS